MGNLTNRPAITLPDGTEAVFGDEAFQDLLPVSAHMWRAIDEAKTSQEVSYAFANAIMGLEIAIRKPGE